MNFFCFLLFSFFLLLITACSSDLNREEVQFFAMCIYLDGLNSRLTANSQIGENQFENVYTFSELLNILPSNDSEKLHSMQQNYILFWNPEVSGNKVRFVLSSQFGVSLFYKNGECVTIRNKRENMK